MNDRYLFRGKRVDGQGWITGYYSTLLFTERSGIYPTDKKSLYSCPNIETAWREVEPATVGQCTGLRDKNGTLIFEGDILHPENWDPAPVVWKFSGWMLDYTDSYEPIDDIPDALIVGNTHDNPELMDETDVMSE